MANNKVKTDDDQEFEQFSIKEFLYLCLGYWKWFLVSIVLFVGMGLFYVYTRQPEYERSEEILVKDQDSGGGVGDIANAFSTLGLFSSNTKVYNELIAITSPAVMFEVVDRLELVDNYTERDGLKRKTLYGKSLPLKVEFSDLSPDANVGFRIKFDPDGTFRLSKFWRMSESGRVKFGDKVNGKIGGSQVKTPVGNLRIVANDAYVPGSTDSEKDCIVVDFFHQSRQGTVEKYNAKLKADLSDQDADVMKLSIRDTSKERADDILNTVVAVYNQRWLNDNSLVSQATSEFIDERLLIIGNELEQVDKEIADHKSEMKLPDLEEAAKGYMSQDFKMNEELLSTSNMLAMSKYLKEYMVDPSHAYSILPINTGTNNQVLENQIKTYNDLLLQRNNLAENSGDQNPIVKDLNKQLSGLRNAIMSSIDSHIANLQNTLANINKAQAQTREKLGSSPQQARALLSVERQQLVMQELFLYLLQKREENQLTQAFTASNTRIITPPYGLSKPVSPKKGLIIIISFILGAGIPFALLFILESSNTKVRSRKDIESLSAPYAGEIPHIGKKSYLKNILKTKKKRLMEGNTPRVVVEDGKRDIPNEAFRVVRSNIDFMISKDERPVIALTSFNPGSGKSFIAYNLGASFALKDKRVLIIDGDLRHGSISSYVNSPRKGLATYLNGHASDWKEMVVNVAEFPKLDVLPIGNRAPNPAELLDNGKLQSLIEEARDIYDVVLVDCPPVNIVVDTQIINQYATRTIFVVRVGLLEKKAIAELNDMVDEKKLRNITVLLNGTSVENSSYSSYGNYQPLEMD